MPGAKGYVRYCAEMQDNSVEHGQDFDRVGNSREALDKAAEMLNGRREPLRGRLG